MQGHNAPEYSLMTQSKAYTHVDAGTAVLGNRWLERRWSAFLGRTISLEQKPGGEWVSHANPEFEVVTEERSFGVMDLGEIEWSEVYTQFGAGLVTRQSGPELLLASGFFAFHETPGMLHSAFLFNRGAAPIRCTRVAIERLAVEREGVSVVTRDFTRRSDAEHWRTDESHAALLRQGHGLVVGMVGGGVFELFAPDPRQCALVTPETYALAPGETMHLPETYMLPFSGEDLDTVRSGALAAMLLQVRKMKKWEAEVKAAQDSLKDIA